MTENKKPKHIEWMCTHCGHKEVRGVFAGRPMPGICSRRTNKQPHRWVRNRIY